MNILFHNGQLCLRGTTIAVYDYADHNENILGNNSYITFNENSPWNNNAVIEKFMKRFPGRVFPYQNFSEINFICDKNKIDSFYAIKSGEMDGILSNRKNLIHVVFQAFQPHGDVYSYVSKWLSKKMTNVEYPYVPHMVSLPSPNINLRDQLGIPKNHFIFGRYGGYDQFNISFVKQAVVEFAEKHKDCYFVFLNTEKFVNHPRIKFFGEIVNLQDKANFIEACDGMIHARAMGESFGLSICEFLNGNKPVLAWSGGHDQNHTEILNKSLLYDNKQNLLDKMERLYRREDIDLDYTEMVSDFTPDKVMNQFKQVFLS